jgi:glycosyltransferase involved in cell wall biosynthesis
LIPEPLRVAVLRPMGGGIAHVALSVERTLREQEGVLVWDVPVAEGGAPLADGLRAAWRARKIIRSADVVHVETGLFARSVFWAALFAGFTRNDLVVVGHDMPGFVDAPGSGIWPPRPGWPDALAHKVVAPVLERPLKAVLRRRVASWVVLTDRAGLEATRQGLGPVTVVDHGADPPISAPPPSQGGYVLFAGFIGPGKGLDVLASAWERVCIDTNLELWISGAVSGGREKWAQQVRERFSRTARPPRWLGYVSDEELPRLVADAAVVVLPYISSNPVSGIAVRALVQGRALIATQVQAFEGEVEHGLTGLLVAPNQSEPLAAALRAVLVDPALRDELGAAASEAALARHSWERHVRQLLTAYALTGAPVNHARTLAGSGSGEAAGPRSC